MWEKYIHYLMDSYFKLSTYESPYGHVILYLWKININIKLNITSLLCLMDKPTLDQTNCTIETTIDSSRLILCKGL